VAEMSQQLKDQIRASCTNMNTATIAALAATIRSGGLDWFVDEFKKAMRNKAITVAGWNQLTSQNIADTDRTLVEKDAKYVWTEVAPNEPFPGIRWT